LAVSLLFTVILGIKELPKARDMRTTKALINHFRGWFPQEPTLSITRSAGTQNEKNGNWALCPFLIPGALIVFAALLSANFGLTIVSLYLPEGGTVIKTGFYIGIFSVVGSVLGLICGGLLLAGKRIHTAAAGLAVILCLSLATVTLPILTGYTWLSGLLVASPMITFLVIALIQIGFNSRKLKTYNAVHEPELTVEAEPQPINRKPVAAGLAAVGLGFILMGLLSFFEAAVFSTMVNEIIIVTGAGLIVAAYLERRTYKHRGLSDGNEM
jgi:hypothetical protein